jgi:hypothetical protein
MEEFKNGHPYTPNKVTPNKIKCNKRTYPYIYDEETETARAKYYLKTENGIEGHEVSIKDVTIDTWGCIHTTAIPQDAFESPSEVIRFKGFIEVDKDGNEKNIGGIGKVIEFTDQQSKALEQFKEAVKNCEDNGIKLIFDTEDGVVRAYRCYDDIVYEYDWCGEVDINTIRPRELTTLCSMSGCYCDDVITLENEEKK